MANTTIKGLPTELTAAEVLSGNEVWLEAEDHTDGETKKATPESLTAPLAARVSTLESTPALLTPTAPGAPGTGNANALAGATQITHIKFLSNKREICEFGINAE